MNPPADSSGKKSAPRKRRPIGGVSPVPHNPATRDLQIVTPPAPAKKQAAAFPGFTYHGGPVIALPEVRASFWGAAWKNDSNHASRAAHLEKFLTDLLASSYMNVLSQYGASGGAGTGRYQGTSFVANVPQNLGDTDIHTIVQQNIDAGVLPEPGANHCLMIFLADGMGVNDPADQIVMCEAANDTAFGYHSFFTTRAGNPFYYAVVPGLNDACLAESCPGNDGGCSLHLSETQEERQTQVASHEFAEMATDPQLNGWFDPQKGENGDICNGESDTLTVGADTWTVQRQYSKTDDLATGGKTFCVVGAPNPLPKIS